MAWLVTHGMTNTRVYSAWVSMRKRCYLSTGKNYQGYGSRGIYVCDSWKDSFNNFYSDMGDPAEGMSLDRIDNDGPYAPENCRWADRSTQQNNTRNNLILAVNGIEKTVTQWAREKNINTSTLRTRLRRGWDHADAVSRQPRSAIHEK